MRFAILSGGTGWHVQDLIRAAHAEGHDAEALDFRATSGSVNVVDTSWDRFDAVIVRTMPAGSLEQVVFRMDQLHVLHAGGMAVVNPPRAVEICVDKYLTSATLQRAGVPTPRTVVCQRSDAALDAFATIGGDVVVKPLFGAEGRGMVRVTDGEVAWRTFRAIEQTGGVIYLQEFIAHPGWDVRAFVLGGRVLASMRRTSADDWRTNASRGATVSPTTLDASATELALAAASAVSAVVAGVDLLPLPGGGWTVLEVNGVPGWQSLATACQIDVARAIIQHAVGIAR